MSRPALLTALLALAACHPAPKGPAAAPVYYDPQRGISSNGSVYPLETPH